jgi:hypothetical protein
MGQQMGFATLIGSWTVLRRRASGFLLGLVFLAAADARADPLRFPWDPPPPPPPSRRLPPPERIPASPERLTTREVRNILAREGAQLIGKPRAIRDELIAIGRDSEGLGHKFVLDAVTGEVLAVVEVGLPEQPRRRDVDRFDLPPPGVGPSDPLPPPVHASPDPGGVSAPPVATAPSAPPANVAASPPAPPRSNADDALSPIKPLRPPGAPKVEPLPQ